MQKIRKFCTYFIIIVLLAMLGVSQDWSNCGSNDPNDELIFIINSIEPLKNNPPEDTTFTLTNPWTINLIRTCHYNYGMGQIPPPNTNFRIEKVDNGEPVINEPIKYRETSSAVEDVYWVVCAGDIVEGSRPIRCDYYPALGKKLSPGTYKIVDPDRSTWSYNAETGGRGITFIYGTRK